MSDLIKLMLPDKEVIPTDDLILSIIGDKLLLWKKLLDFIDFNLTDVSGTWHYYNDGKQWLFKMVRKKKTIFWAAVQEDAFRITFYFGDKAEPLLGESNLPQKIKDNFKTSKRYGAIRAISVRLINESDIEVIKELISVKLKIK
jgi:hypothetical protein